MVESLLNKTLFVIFFLSVINVIRHGWKIFMILRDDELPNKYELSKRELIFLGLSLSYLFSTIFTGIKI